MPGFKVLEKNVYLALECDLVNRVVHYRGRRLNHGLMQRYGLFGGITLFRRGKHRGSLLIGTGVASDFAEPGADMLYGHFIYDHRIAVSEGLELGLGILFPYNFGETRDPVINLLPTVLWSIKPGTFLTVAWDAVELRRWLRERFALVADVRYDLSFFRLADHTTIELETVGAGGGCDIRLWDDWYVRARYKKILLKNERLRIGGAESVLDGGAGGHSVRLLVAYAK